MAWLTSRRLSGVFSVRQLYPLMISHDYTQELGLKPNAPIVPMPIALLILAVGGGVLWFGVTKLNERHDSQHAAQDALTAPAGKPAPAN